MRKVLLLAVIASLVVVGVACKEKKPAAKTYPVTLITLNPGHFHAGLVQKTMYEQVSPTVFVMRLPGGC
jgi:hypothetical protein